MKSAMGFWAALLLPCVVLGNEVKQNKEICGTKVCDQDEECINEECVPKLVPLMEQPAPASLPLEPLSGSATSQPKNHQPTGKPSVQPLSVEALKAPNTDEYSILKFGGYGVSGVGLLAVGLGAVFGVQSRLAYNSAPNAPTLDEFEADKQAVRDNNFRADLCFAVGGGAIAIGLTMIILDGIGLFDG